MNRVFLKFIAAVSLSAFLFTGEIAYADPVGDFFRRLSNSISNAGKRAPARRAGQKSTGRKSSKDPNTVDPNKEDAREDATAPDAISTPAPTVRPALEIPNAGGRRRDLPYAVPVPDKPGFVTSPYAPKQGFVDVRGFPSGTEVKDPYTGKAFLTP